MLGYLVPTVVIAFLSIWVVSSDTLETQIRDRVSRGLKLSATGLATTLDATLNDMISDAATTARLYLPQEAIESGDPKNFQWYADELVSKKNRYLAIIVSDSDGRIIGIARWIRPVKRASKIMAKIFKNPGFKRYSKRNNASSHLRQTLPMLADFG